ncbi:alkaline phosphatase, partial [Micromonospora sp. NPDC005113]
ATGLVTTAQVTDASPAAFFANTANRSAQDEIEDVLVFANTQPILTNGSAAASTAGNRDDQRT